MGADAQLSEFIKRAKETGVPDDSIAGMLTGRGWPEKEVSEALATHYEQMIGLVVPQRESSATAAKDAFFHLVMFSTLATWTIGASSLAFVLIDKWLADSLFAGYWTGYDSRSIASSMASMLVSFPIFLLVSRAVLRDLREHPAKLGSPVRKWLTYMALVVAAGVVIGDLIVVLGYFLNGEITARFLSKAFVVLVLSGGVFYYYFGGLRKNAEGEPDKGTRQDSLMAGVSLLAVIVLTAGGFWSLGSPYKQRTLRADYKRVQDLYQVSDAIHSRWVSGSRPLPRHLEELPRATVSDPLTGAAYEYRVKDDVQYDLCATFSLASDEAAGHFLGKWRHPAGHYCFALSADQSPQNPNIYIPD